MIVLEYKTNNEKVVKQFELLNEVFDTIKEYNIQYGNLKLYNFDIKVIQNKLKERNL